MNDVDENGVPFIKITRDMRYLAKQIGRMRSMMNIWAETPDTKMGPQARLDSDEYGALGELALAKWRNVYPDLSFENRNGTPDCRLGRYLIDVKSTQKPAGQLVATLKINRDVDVYALALVLKDVVKFPGFAYREQFCQRANIGNLGYGPTYVLPQGRLRKWKYWSPEPL